MPYGASCYMAAWMETSLDGVVFMVDFEEDCKLAKSIATLFQRSLLCSPCSLSVGGNKACIQFRVFIELVNFHVPFAFLVSRLRKKLISQVSCSVEKIETGGICHG